MLKLLPLEWTVGSSWTSRVHGHALALRIGADIDGAAREGWNAVWLFDMNIFVNIFSLPRDSDF